MKTPRRSPARLWALLAREAHTGVVFRRGPSRQVQLVKWNLESDQFEAGQWFKGRIYERRCDLSPDGTLLIYFAANWKEPLRSWTAISRLPWFTALALWPKGDAWNGGGRFIDFQTLHLAHTAWEVKPHPDFVEGCAQFRVASYAKGFGEDAPGWHATLLRDRWTLVQAGEWKERDREQDYGWKARVPETWRKPSPVCCSVHLEMLIEGLHQRNGPWYVTRYRLVNEPSHGLEDLGLIDWADWDRNGDLLFAQRGCLFRRVLQNCELLPPLLLADFNAHVFEEVAPPSGQVVSR